jgi:hypothetical protein
MGSLKKEGAFMQRRHGQRSFATISRVIFLISILTIGFCGSTSATILGFGPPTNVVAEVSPDLPKYELRRIGMIAFVNRSSTPNAGVRVANLFFHTLDTYHRFELTPPLMLDETTELAFTCIAQGGPEEEGPGRLRRFVYEWIGQMWPSTVQPSEVSQNQTPGRPKPTHQSPPPLDAVLTGVILRYEDRVGHALSVDRPASVAYEAYLISARDGGMLWQARFDETQKPLLDNPLLAGRFFQGGGVWQTSDTLTRIGLERVLETFPGIAHDVLP